MEEQLRLQEEKWVEQQAQNKLLQDKLRDVMFSIQEMNGRLKATDSSSSSSSSVHDGPQGEGFNPTRIRGYVPKLDFLKLD